MNGHPIDYAFDNNDAQNYWVAQNENTENYHNNITVTFNIIQAIEAFLFYPSFSGANRAFHGTPLKLNVLAGTGDGKFDLKAVFYTEPEKDWKHFQFVFGRPIVCKQMRLEFVEVTVEKFSTSGLKCPSAGGITFLRTEVPEATAIPPATEYPPSPSPSRSAFPAYYECGESNVRCNIENKEETTTTSVSVRSSEFKEIRLINSGLECANTKFTKCESTNGGGGGIYINNDIDKKVVVTLEYLQFNKCQALYGGAVYVYCSSPSVPVTVRNCKFNSNVATAKKGGSGTLYGGAALYLHAMEGILIDNEFTANKGSTVKIINDFDSQKSQILDYKNSFVLISRCRLEDNLKSDCLIFYVAGANGASFKVNDCIFTGSLHEDSHYIDGLSLSKDAQKLHVENCKFSSDYKSSLNLENGFLSVDLKSQIFNFNQSTSKKNEKSRLSFTNLIFAASAVVVAFALVLLVKHRKQTQNSEQNEESSENNDLLIEQSLI